MATNEWVAALSGASGQIYGITLVRMLAERCRRVHVVFTGRAKEIAKVEEDVDLSAGGIAALLPARLRKRVVVYGAQDWTAPFASGRHPFKGMVVAPCCMGTLARIAHGISSNIIERAADVALKERRKVVLVTRETPLSLIHLENMAGATRAGAVVLPACPGFYLKPESVQDLVDFVAERAVAALGAGAAVSGD